MLLGKNDSPAFIHCGASMTTTSDGGMHFISDANDNDGLAPSGDMTFGFGCSVDTDSSRDFTYSEIGNSGRARNRLLVLKSSNECVGISTDDPKHKMHIVGKIGEDASLCIEAEGKSDSAKLYLGTSEDPTQGCYAKAAIIAEGIGSWSTVSYTHLTLPTKA